MLICASCLEEVKMFERGSEQKHAVWQGVSVRWNFKSLILTVWLSNCHFSLWPHPLMLFVGTLDNHQVILSSFCNTLSSFSFHFTHVKWRVGGLLSVTLTGQKTVCQDSSLTNQTPARKKPRRHKETFVWEERRADSTKKLQNWCDGTRKQSATYSFRLWGHFQQLNNSYMEEHQ